MTGDRTDGPPGDLAGAAYQDTRRNKRGDPHAMVPAAEPRSYYDQPVLKQPVWTVEIPWYLFAGGLAGGSSILAVTARRRGEHPAARIAERVALGAALASPALLISDLGRPARFLNMLRVVKVTSPMSIGSWILAAYGPAAFVTAALGATGRAPRLRNVAGVSAAGLGGLLATYTSVLLTDTAIPVWHDAGRVLPFAFAGGAAQSAGAAVVLFVPPEQAASGRWALVGGAMQREVASQVMVRQLGEVGAPLGEGRAGRYHRVSRWASLVGAGLAATVGRRSRVAAMAGGALATAGAIAERFAVFEAGFASAADPHATTGPQRRRLERA